MNSPKMAPFAVNVTEACRLTGLGPTTVWTLVKDGKLDAVRPVGMRRTLISYKSLYELIERSLDKDNSRAAKTKIGEWQKQNSHRAKNP